MSGENPEARVGHRGEDDDVIQYVQYTAGLGNVASLRMMGQLHYYGARGLARDPLRAAQYFR
jgi:TPR repeat protein